jgi:hypothetical protein
MKTILAIICLASTCVWENKASIIAHWTFESSKPALENSATIGGIVAEAGVNSALSTASGSHASALTDWSNPVGNGSAESFSVNTWATGDYFQFQTSLSGYQDVKLTWAQSRSSTGPADFQLAYSIDGITFTDFGSQYLVSVLTTDWSSGTANADSIRMANLSAITALNNDGSVFFRLISKVTPAAGGTSRVDDFMIEATPIPEPAEWGAIACLGLLMMFAIQNWRQRRSSVVER